MPAPVSTLVRPSRVAVVLSRPTPHTSSWFVWLQAHTALDFRVFYLWDAGEPVADDNDDVLADYPYEFVPNIARDPGTHHFGGIRNPSLPVRLAAWRPDVLWVFGHGHPSHLSAIVWAREHGVPLVFRRDTHGLSHPAPRGWKRLLLRLLYRQCSAVMCRGAADRDYFTAVGVPPQRLFFSPHAVDDSHFDPARHDHVTAASALRSALGLGPSTHVVLFAGTCDSRNQPHALLEAFLAARAPDSALVFVGEGEEKASLQTFAANAPPGMVHFLPSADRSEMPARYLLADLFVQPSAVADEAGSLAVYEAMNMGVPCLVSDGVDCQRDLVMDGETGWVFPRDQPGALAEGLRVALAAILNPDTRVRVRAAVRARITRHTFAHATDGLLASLACARPPAVHS